MMLIAYYVLWIWEQSLLVLLLILSSVL